MQRASRKCSFVTFICGAFMCTPHPFTGYKILKINKNDKNIFLLTFEKIINKMTHVGFNIGFNMKNKLLLLAICASSVVHAEVDSSKCPLHGPNTGSSSSAEFYFGGQVGAAFGKPDKEVFADINGREIRKSLGGSAKSFCGGLHFGFNWKRSGFFMGPQLRYTFMNARNKWNTLLEGTDNGVQSLVRGRMSIKGIFDASLLIGFCPVEKMKLYGRVGFALARKSEQAEAFVGGQKILDKKASRVLPGVLFGAGASYNILGNLDLGIEYSCSIFGKEKTARFKDSRGILFEGKAKRIPVHMVLVNMSYRIPFGGK